MLNNASLQTFDSASEPGLRPEPVAPSNAGGLSRWASEQEIVDNYATK